MKKNKFFSFIILLLVILLAATFVSCGITYEEASTNESSSGENLNGYLARISYLNYTLYGSGHYIAYILTYDHTYYQKKKSSLSDLLGSLASSFDKNGYSVSVDTYTGEMTASITFETTEEFYKQTGYDGFEISDNSASDKKSTLFYTTYTYNSKTIFSDINKDYKYVGRLLSDGCFKGGITSEYVQLEYVYGTPYSQKTITSDADSVTYDQNKEIYLHSFIMTTDTCDRIITISQRSPNTTIWYIFSIIGGIIVFTVPLAIVIFKRKKRS